MANNAISIPTVHDDWGDLQFTGFSVYRVRSGAETSLGSWSGGTLTISSLSAQIGDLIRIKMTWRGAYTYDDGSESYYWAAGGSAVGDSAALAAGTTDIPAQSVSLSESIVGGYLTASPIPVYVASNPSGAAPTVTTQAVSGVGTSTATGNGNVTSDGGSTITERGVCINTTGSPTTASTKFSTSGTTGAFTAAMSSLVPGTRYYLRPYAINAFGTSYGSEVQFTTFPLLTAAAGSDAGAIGSLTLTVAIATSPAGSEAGAGPGLTFINSITVPAAAGSDGGASGALACGQSVVSPPAGAGAEASGGPSAVAGQPSVNAPSAAGGEAGEGSGLTLIAGITVGQSAGADAGTAQGAVASQPSVNAPSAAGAEAGEGPGVAFTIGLTVGQAAGTDAGTDPGAVAGQSTVNAVSAPGSDANTGPGAAAGQVSVSVLGFAGADAGAGPGALAGQATVTVPGAAGSDAGAHGGLSFAVTVALALAAGGDAGSGPGAAAGMLGVTLAAAAGADAGAGGDLSFAIVELTTYDTPNPTISHNIVVFDPTTEEAVAILSNTSKGACPFWDDAHLETLAGVLTYDFTAAANHEDAARIIAKAPLLIHDSDGASRLLRIERVDDKREKANLTKVVYAENAAQELGGFPMVPATFANKAPGFILAEILSGTRYEVGQVDSIGALAAFDAKDWESRLFYLRALQTACGLEMRFRVTFDGCRITHRYVDLLTRIGADWGVVWEPSKNLPGLTRTVDSTAVFTAMVGLGKADANGNYVNLYNLSAPDKPLHTYAVLDDDALAVYGLPTNPRTHITGVYRNPDCADANQLLAEARAALARAVVPAVTYQVDPILLEKLGAEYGHEKVRLGDTVTVRDLALYPPLVTSIRVTEVSRSYANESVALKEGV